MLSLTDNTVKDDCRRKDNKSKMTLLAAVTVAR